MNNPTVKSVVQDIEYQEPSISEIETVGSFDLIPNWPNVARFFKEVKKHDPMAYQRIKKKYSGLLEAIENY